MRAVGWVRVCGGWRRHLDEERQLQEFSPRKENITRPESPEKPLVKTRK